MILLKTICMVNVGEVHTRVMTQVNDEFAKVGGLTEIFYVGAWLLYVILCPPFQDLYLGIQFDRLMNELEVDRPKDQIEEYAQHMHCWFYFKYFARSRLPKCVREMLCKSDNNEESFSKIVRYLD